VRVIARRQWTPELAEDIARAEAVVFIDCSIASAPGSVTVVEVQACGRLQGLATHHVGAAELLGLARDLYSSLPRSSVLLTVGAGSTELGQTFSGRLLDAIPEARGRLERTVLELLRRHD